MIVKKCEVVKVEAIVRGYITGVYCLSHIIRFPVDHAPRLLSRKVNDPFPLFLPVEKKG